MTPHPHEGPINHRRLLWKYLVHVVAVGEYHAFLRDGDRIRSSPIVQWFTDDEWAELRRLDGTETYGDAPT